MGRGRRKKKGDKKVEKKPEEKGFQLPTKRSEPVSNLWQYAYLIMGEKKIGKTSFAIEGCEEFVIQFDKPQLAYDLRETCPKSWDEFMRVLKALEKAAKTDDFPYNRIIIDGVGEWYTQCTIAACKVFGVDHPSEVGYAKCWHWIRDHFLDVVNRLLRLQITAECGLIFITHSEWKEVNTRWAGKMEKMVPDLAGKCESVVAGKSDGWFTYDYVLDQRVLIVRGDEITSAGHRIDGRFNTPDGRQVREIYMGNSSEEALENFLKAFNNEQEYTTYKELKDSQKEKTKTKKARRRKKSA